MKEKSQKNTHRNIYLSSRMECHYHEVITKLLREDGHTVYNFHESPLKLIMKDFGINSTDLTPAKYRELMSHPKARSAFDADFDALNKADTIIAILPAGPSSGWELGYSKAKKKDVILYVPAVQYKADLMLGTTSSIACSFEEIQQILAGPTPSPEQLSTREQLLTWAHRMHNASMARVDEVQSQYEELKYRLDEAKAHEAECRKIYEDLRFQ